MGEESLNSNYKVIYIKVQKSEREHGVIAHERKRHGVYLQGL